MVVGPADLVDRAAAAGSAVVARVARVAPAAVVANDVALPSMTNPAHRFEHVL